MTSRNLSLVALMLVATLPYFAQTGTLTPAQTRAKAKAQNVPEIPYEAVPNFLKLPPNVYLGEGIGVATNSKGHVFVYTRSEDTRLFEFDQKGNYIREIGEGLYGFAFAHAVRVDSQDNIWAVDEGTNMVIKFNPEGRVLMVLGHRPESVFGIPITPGFGAPTPAAEPYTFNRPTDVAWDPSGNIFVRGEVRQERTIHRVDWDQGLRARPVQSSTHDGGRCQGKHLRRRSKQCSHPGLR
jgi:hypothetical protein